MVAIILNDIVINKCTKQATFCNFAIYSSSNLYIWQTQSKTDCICPIAVHSYTHTSTYSKVTDTPIYISMDKICFLHQRILEILARGGRERLDSRFTVNLQGLLPTFNLQLSHCGDLL